jgi:CheY-like chemotaxis protein
VADAPAPIDIGLTGRKKVLVAEDEQNIAALLEDWLSDNFEVMTALNGAAALQKARWNKPDVLLLDIMMPDTGGYEVVCALQGDPGTARIPIIVMTAKNFDDSTVKLIKAEPNVYGFINKPFKPDELKKQIAQALAGQRTFAAPAAARRFVPGAAHPAPPAPPQAPPAPVSLPPVPPTPGPTLAPPPAPAAPPPPAPFTIVQGFPEIVPTSAMAPGVVPSISPPAPPAPAASPPRPPLPPFLKPTHSPKAVPAPPAPAAQPSGLVEPTTAVPPAPTQEPLEFRPSLPPSSGAEFPPPAPRFSKLGAARARVAPRSPSEDDDGPDVAVLVFKLLLRIFKWVFLAGAVAAAVVVTAEVSTRWTEKALGKEVFVPPLRPSRYAELPYTLPVGGGWVQGGVGYSVNDWGLRSGRVDLIKPPNTVRVFLLGGSALFGEGVPVERTVAGRAEALFAEERGVARYEVINGGVWGYSPEEQWAFYEKAVSELKPDVLVWLCEEKPGGIPSSEKLRELARSSVLSSFVFSGSRFARVLMARSLASGPPPRRPDFLPLIQSAETFVRQNDGRFLYAVFPAAPLDAEGWAELPSKSRLDIGETSREGYVDPRGRVVSYDLVARAIVARVRELKLGGPDKEDLPAPEAVHKTKRRG